MEQLTFSLRHAFESDFFTIHFVCGTFYFFLDRMNFRLKMSGKSSLPQRYFSFAGIRVMDHKDLYDFK